MVKAIHKIVPVIAWLKKPCGTLLLFLSLLPFHLQAQNKPALEYQVKAAFLFNFTRFVNWPSTAFRSADAPFVIGIIGNDHFGSYLDDLTEGEKLDDHKIVIERYADIKDIVNCQILYIESNDPTKIRDILALAGHRAILTVCDADKFTKWGGCIHFYRQDNRIKMEINVGSAKACQLEISAKLLKVARTN